MEDNHRGFYTVSDVSLSKVLCVTSDLAVDAMRDAGITDNSVEKMGDVRTCVCIENRCSYVVLSDC